MTEVTLRDVESARERFDESVVQRTEIERSRSLSEMTGAAVHLKMEHLQRTGSFKTRGAYNKLQQVAERGEASRVVAASAGNHAQGVALAATKTGIDSTIVMPENAPQAKVEATRGYGADVELRGEDFRAAMEYARSLTEADDTEFVHAYDDPAIVAGQGTIGLEIHEQLPEADAVVVPIGGGGLIGGVGAALAELDPEVRVVGVQAEQAATVPESLDKGIPAAIDSPKTIADGIATGSISELTLGLIEEHVDEVVTVSDDEIARAELVLLERAKQLVEAAGASSVAAVLSEDLDVSDETVVPILSGGNIDISMLQTVLTQALTERSQLMRLRVRIEDEPGEMTHLSGIIADTGANIRTVRHDRAVDDLRVGEAYLVFQVVTSGTGHAENIVEKVRDSGYEVERVA
ncbi:threonine ammonia-lyase [Halorussus gelatinilyticus]|uniref:threonine ammonia-lyase n=1 Tax=Halorussus gelatinilyticus TaxID=2937524 RepID=A0A8U0IP97_9EURY|nr:threonine ammonia-lyase [Halorussus gelatinilyticus]UPW01829.1 threonine ammonia-lyase [Halorussus gelatinilyticus]